MAERTLTPVEIDVLLLIAHGLSDRQIAAAQYKSLRTIHAHRDHLLAKTGCRNRVELTRFAIAAGYVPSAWNDYEEHEVWG
jgi:DNA-binding NarL/FixJ family response regulator